MENLPKNKYLGHLCVKGHRWQGIDKSLRYIKGKKCIECSKEKIAKWYKENYKNINQEKHKASSKKSYNKHKDKIKAKYQEKNKDKILVRKLWLQENNLRKEAIKENIKRDKIEKRRAKWYKKYTIPKRTRVHANYMSMFFNHFIRNHFIHKVVNPEKQKQQIRDWYYNNLEHCKATSKNYRKNNLEKCKQLRRDWYHNNLEHCREKNNAKIKEMPDYYITQLLGMGKEVPDELIKTKRELLRLHRTILTKKKGN